MTIPPNAPHQARWEYVLRLAEGILEDIQEPTADLPDGTAGIRIYVRQRGLALKRTAEGALIDFGEEPSRYDFYNAMLHL